MDAPPLAPMPDADRCFVCGPANAHGLHLPFRVVGDAVEAAWVADAAYEGWGGILHGGLYAALHDDAAHWAMIALSARTGLTTRLDVRFRRAVRLGERVRVLGRVERVEDKRGVFSTEIRLPDGALASDATAEFAFVSPATLERVLGRALSPELRAWLADDDAGRRARVHAWSVGGGAARRAASEASPGDAGRATDGSEAGSREKTLL